MRSSIFGIYHSGGVFHPSATYIGQFGKPTDRTEGTPVPELAEGPLSKQYIYTVAHASGSEKQCSSFRVSASVFSVKFRVNPWLIFSLLLPLLSVYSVLKPSRWGWVN